MIRNQTQSLAVVAAARTPFSKAFTQLRDVSAVQLGQVALLDALRRCGLSTSDIDEVIFGNVAGPPDSANLARVIALKAGLPVDRIAHTVNRNCGSGMESIVAGWQAIGEGRARLVVAGGTESMSNIPLLWNRDAASWWLRMAKSKTVLQRLRAVAALRPRHFKPVMGIQQGLVDPVSGLNMGETAEVLADEFGISRPQQDEFALHSHRKAEAAQVQCFLSGEIAMVPARGGQLIETDNGIRYGQSMEALSSLRPIFDPQGTVTAGNSCPLTDGAAALVLTAPDDLDRFDTPPLGFITSYAVAGCAPHRMGLGPVYATAKLLRQTGLSINDFDLIEINEAFAAQVLACQKALASKRFAESELGWSEAIGEIPPQKLNVHGGAIALGHPVGASGTRLILTLLRALKSSGQRRGLATLCVGGGQGVAMVVQSERE